MSLESSGMWRRVFTLKWTYVSEVRTASIFTAIVMMMEAVRISETSVHFNVTTRRYIPEDSKLHTRCRENLKSHINFNVIILCYAFQVVSSFMFSTKILYAFLISPTHYTRSEHFVLVDLNIVIIFDWHKL
jgi:hypothetical protein